MIQPNRLRRFVAVGACALALATGVGLLARSSAPRPAYANPLAAGDRIADTAERVVDSVVNISTTQAVARGPFAFDPFWNDPGSPSFGQADPRRASSLGSGVIVSTDGRVLTNAHVIGDAEAIRVTLRDGLELDATLIGADPKSDLAVLQLVPAKGQKLPALKPLPLGDSSKLRLGQVVLAVGNPFGVGQAVTMGIVSRGRPRRPGHRGLRGLHPDRRRDQPRQLRRRAGRSRRQARRHQHRDPVALRRVPGHRLRDPDQHGQPDHGHAGQGRPGVAGLPGRSCAAPPRGRSR
jgi:hypothetical protein